VLKTLSTPPAVDEIPAVLRAGARLGRGRRADVGKTSIEWTDHSWPIVNGCRRVSAGCENCYAERLTATRLSRTPKYKGLAVSGKKGPHWTGESRLWTPHLDMPLKLKRPVRIFVADMGDLFYDQVSNEEIAAVFGVMAAAPQHTFQVLTKRPRRMAEWFRWVADAEMFAHLSPAVKTGMMLRWYAGVALRGAGKPFPATALQPWPLPNVWLGTSVEDQATADERIPHLLATPAAMRFVSAEPLLGPIELPLGPTLLGHERPDGGVEFTSLVPRLDWVIVGGESGPGAREFDIEWARSLLGQCRAAGVAAFVKQLGARAFQSPRYDGDIDYSLEMRDRKGGDPAEWPEDLRVREFPSKPKEKQEAVSGGAAGFGKNPGSSAPLG
jgi:protein gp37